VRIERAKEMLSKTDRSVFEIAIDVGFTESQYFSTVFKQETGYTPSQYRSVVCRPNPAGNEEN
ncbi:MAG: helix-turn-helix transcriptional regulator, partial [Bacteroidaceae bacterium]|nr:helix-turn-helix transcriptional regulator [Bacteroidaceae bacterium]